jgi:formimidoylglutamate deiminase
MMNERDWKVTPERGVWTEEGLRTDTTVVVRSNRIVEVSAADRHPDAPVLPGRVLLPGLVDAHSHAFQRAIRGHVQYSADPHDDFWTWRERMYRAAHTLTPEGLQAISALAYLEMVEAGFTAVGEFHYLHRDPTGAVYADPDELALRVIGAAESVGLRICLLRVVYAAGGFGRPLSGAQARFRTDSPEEALAAVERLDAFPSRRVTAGLAPHSVRAVPPAWLPELRTNRVVHAHVSEQPAEVGACRAATGRTPLALLADAGLVDERFTAVHLTHPTDDELVSLRQARGRIAVCPTTELDLGDGFLPVAAREGIALCIGTDSHARIDPFEEMRALEMHARGLARRRIVMGTPGHADSLVRALLDAGSVQGARALGLEGRGIVAGAVADLVAVDLRRPEALGVPPVEAVVFNATPDWVTDVWVDGRHVVRDGRHPDRDRVVAAARPVLEALQQQ